LEKRFSKLKTTIFSKNWGGMAPLSPPGCVYARRQFSFSVGTFLKFVLKSPFTKLTLWGEWRWSSWGKNAIPVGACSLRTTAWKSRWSCQRVFHTWHAMYDFTVR